jgi:hypothetical protein
MTDGAQRLGTPPGSKSTKAGGEAFRFHALDRAGGIRTLAEPKSVQARSPHRGDGPEWRSRSGLPGRSKSMKAGGEAFRFHALDRAGGIRTHDLLTPRNASEPASTAKSRFSRFLRGQHIAFAAVRARLASFRVVPCSRAVWNARRVRRTRPVLHHISWTGRKGAPSRFGAAQGYPPGRVGFGHAPLAGTHPA